jgi:2-succinyl-5-enolpyruvyl-6-hydroxy-3-cyclohexene-1-carboxylate synthase
MKPKSWEEVIPLIEKPIEQGIRLIEFNTDRKSDKKVRKRLLSIGPYV